jgi:hypothetical protein
MNILKEDYRKSMELTLQRKDNSGHVKMERKED